MNEESGRAKQAAGTTKASAPPNKLSGADTFTSGIISTASRVDMNST